ncbi:MAG: carboxypeptidase regulatory-like domain-containing protein, partial [Bryobacterales bacterium]|nr:carboxypeptidase regulatory-like domain-containing protein [Bryobacterales bacterium]
MRIALLAVVASLSVLVPLSAQTGLGIVRGTALDPTGAAIPNAKAVLSNKSTGVSQTVHTTAVGAYYFAAVQPAPHSLVIEAAGFKKWTANFTLEAGQTASIDAKMEVGSVDAVVEVSDVATAITTVGMEINDVKDALRIRQLPLNGRDVRNLFNLTPGVEGGGVPRVNGMKVGSADISLDGISLV